MTENSPEPLVTAACGVADVVQKLKTEKIYDQKKTIGLQEKVISVQDKSLARIQETVKNGIQSYAYVVEKSCSEVKNASKAENRSRNVVIYCVEEKSAEVVGGR